jgi:hypothetical protein
MPNQLQAQKKNSSCSIPRICRHYTLESGPCSFILGCAAFSHTACQYKSPPNFKKHPLCLIEHEISLLQYSIDMVDMLHMGSVRRWEHSDT